MKFTDCIQNAASRLQDQNGSEERTYDRVRDILYILQDVYYSGKSLQQVNSIIQNYCDSKFPLTVFTSSTDR